MRSYPVTLSSALSSSRPVSKSSISTCFLHAFFPFLLDWLCCAGAPIVDWLKFRAPWRAGIVGCINRKVLSKFRPLVWQYLILIVLAWKTSSSHYDVSQIDRDRWLILILISLFLTVSLFVVGWMNMPSNCHLSFMPKESYPSNCYKQRRAETQSVIRLA